MSHDKVSVRLPLRATPEADESLVGFLTRLAERNRLDNPLWLARVVGIPFATVDVAATTPFDLGLLSSVSGIDVLTLARMAYWPSGTSRRVTFLDHRIGREMVTLRHRRACPRCLFLSDHHRAPWDLSVVTVCPHHAIRLIDCCPACGSGLGWTHGSVASCRCGADLRSAPTEPVSREELGGVVYLYRTLGLPVTAPGHEPVGDPLVGLGADEAASLLLHLGWYASGGRLRPRPIKLSSSPELHRWLDLGYRACLDWPRNFHAFLDRLRTGAGARPGRYGLTKQFGPVVDWALDPNQLGDLGTMLRGAVNAYLGQHASIRSRSGKVPRQTDSGALTLSQAADQLGRSITRVRTVLEGHGLIAAHDGLGRGAPVLIEAAAISMLLRNLDDLVDRDGARTLLGCSGGIATEILDGTLIGRARGPAAELFGRTSWRRSELATLVEALGCHAGAGGVPADPIPLPHALRILRLRGTKPVEVLRAALDGRLGIMAIDHAATGLARIIVDATACLHRPSQRTSFSIPEAARELGLKQEVAYGLCNAGILGTVMGPQRRGRCISIDEVERFRATYVVASQLGFDRGRHRGWAAERLIQGGIVPVSGPTVDGRRQYVFRREDLVRVRPRDVRSG